MQYFGNVLISYHGGTSSHNSLVHKENARPNVKRYFYPNDVIVVLLDFKVTLLAVHCYQPNYIR